MRMTKTVFWAGAVLLLASSPANALETFKIVETRTFDVGTSPTINIEAISGDVSFVGVEGTKASVEIVIRVQARDSAEAEEIRSHLKLIVEGETGFLDARMTNSREFHNWLRDEYSRKHHVSVGFNVTGPHGAEGAISSISGNANIENVKGPIEVSAVSGDASATRIEKSVRANSTSGNVDVRRVGGLVVASSVSGDVTISGCGGDLDVESTSGDVNAIDVSGSLTAETVSGDVDVRGVGGSVSAECVSGSIWIENREGAVRASTTSGDINVQTLSIGDIELESLSGSVDLALEPQAFGDVFLSAPSGGIDSDLPIKIRRQSDGRLEGKLGSGAASLRVTTNSGDISVGEL